MVAVRDYFHIVIASVVVRVAVKIIVLPVVDAAVVTVHSAVVVIIVAVPVMERCVGYYS